MPATEEGQQQWTQVVAYLNTPPVERVRARRAPVAALPAGTPVTSAQQAAALSAFMGTVGG